MIINVLSVKQPWAWLICAGFKPIENRSWVTYYQGELYIHAGKQWDKNAMQFLIDNDLLFVADKVRDHFGLALTEHKKIKQQSNEFGAIVGRVNLDYGNTLLFGSEWSMEGNFQWQLSNPVQIEPIPLRGQLQIFKADIDESLIKIKGQDK